MSSVLTGKPQLNRIINRRLILEKIRRQGKVSRADLAKQTAIRPPTVSAVIRELLDDGLVKEVGIGKKTGGRMPQMLALNHNQPLTLGFELSETSIHAGLCDLAGTLTSKMKVSITPPSPEEAVEQLYEIGSGMLEDAGLTWEKLVGVGVAVPGHLNFAEGRIRWSKPFGWRDVPLKSMCEERWKTTTDVVNDSIAGGMAAHLFDVKQSVDNLVFLYLRFEDVKLDVIGVGTGIIIHGEPFHGEFGAAGEITLPLIHPLVYAKQLGAQFETVEDFTRAFQEKDPRATEAISKVGEDIASLARHIVNLLEPGVLMLGSDAPVLRDALLDLTKESLRKHRLDYELGETQLLASTLGEYGVVRGATVPTLQRLFRMPQWA